MYLVFDIGGTSFRVASVENDKILSHRKFNTPNFLQGYNENEISNLLVQYIVDAINEQGRDAEYIGIAFPGPVNDKGIVVSSPVIHGKLLSEPFPLESILKEKTHNPNIRVVNDMTAAAYRYIQVYNNFCLITISTGIGNKVIIDRNVIISSEGVEGELGHVRTDSVNIEIPCDCGRGLNHLNAICSGRGVVNVANILKNEQLKDTYMRSVLYGKKLNEYLIAGGADNGDLFCRELLDICTRPVAQAVCTLLNTIYLQKIIFIGGFFFGCHYYFEALNKNIVSYAVYNQNPDQVRSKLMPGYSDDLNGLIGMKNYIDKLLKVSC